jgi:hypothetical protein
MCRHALFETERAEMRRSSRGARRAFGGLLMFRREILVVAAIWCQVGCSRNEGSLCDPENELDFSALAIDISGEWRRASGDEGSDWVSFDAQGAPLSVDRGANALWGDFSFGCEESTQFPLELGATNETPGLPTEGGGYMKTLTLAEVGANGYVLGWSLGTEGVDYRMEVVVVDGQHINFDFTRPSDEVELRPYVRDDALWNPEGSGVRGIDHSVDSVDTSPGPEDLRQSSSLSDTSRFDRPEAP